MSLRLAETAQDGPIHVTSRRLWSVVGISAAMLLAAMLSGRFLGVANLVYALAVPIGIGFGAAGALGFALGGLFAALWTNSATLASLVQFGGDFVLVAAATALWNGRRLPGIDDGWREWLAGLGAYVLTAAVAVVGNVAVVSLGLLFLDRVPVAASVPILIGNRLGFVLGGGLVVLLAVSSTLRPAPAATNGRRTLTNRRRLGVGLVLCAWLTGAFTLSLIRQDITSVPGARSEFFAYVPEAVAPALEFLLGQQYHVVQLLCTAVALAVLSLVWRPRSRE